MKFLCRLVASIVLCVFAQSLLAQEPTEIFHPTTMIEMSPEIGGQYYRLHGKIEGAAIDQQSGEELANRFIEWFEKAGNPAPVTFEQAHQELMEKLADVDRQFDESKRRGTLESWLLSGTSASVAPASVAPAPPPSESPKDVAMVASEPAHSAAMSEKAVQVVVMPQDKKEERSLGTTESAIGAVFLALLTLSGYKIYPRFFESRAASYHDSPWQRFKERSRFTFAWVVGWIVAISVLGDLLRSS